MIYDDINVLRGRKLSLEGASLIGTGATCNVYLLPDDNVVKVLFSDDYKEAEREIHLAKWAFMKGIPTAISYDVADVDGHPGLLYESLGRDNLRNHLKNEPEQLDVLLSQYLQLIQTINAIEVEEGIIPSAKQGALDEISLYQDLFDEKEQERIRLLIQTIPDERRMIHGDIHIKNIKFLNGKPYLIDLDTLSMGDPIFELRGLCCCYDAYSKKNVGSDGYNDFFDIDHSIIKAAYCYVMDHYYDKISEEDKKENRLKIELLAYLHMLKQLDPDDIKEKDLFIDMQKRVRERLFLVNDLILKKE